MKRGAAPRPRQGAHRPLRPARAGPRAACSRSSSARRRRSSAACCTRAASGWSRRKTSATARTSCAARTRIADAKAGQVVAIELTEPPSMHSQPVGRVTEVLGEIDDPGMEIEIAVRKYEVPHVFSDAALAQAAALPDTVGAADRKGRDRPAPTCRWSRSTARTRAISTTPSIASRPRSAAKRQRLAPDRRDRRRQPLREAGRAARRRRLRARDLGLLPAPGHPDAAGEALERPVLAQPRGRPPGDGLRHARQRATARSTPTSSIRR